MLHFLDLAIDLVGSIFKYTALQYCYLEFQSFWIKRQRSLKCASFFLNLGIYNNEAQTKPKILDTLSGFRRKNAYFMCYEISIALCLIPIYWQCLPW